MLVLLLFLFFNSKLHFVVFLRTVNTNLGNFNSHYYILVYQQCEITLLLAFTKQKSRKLSFFNTDIFFLSCHCPSMDDGNKLKDLHRIWRGPKNCKNVKTQDIDIAVAILEKELQF